MLNSRPSTVFGIVLSLAGLGVIGLNGFFPETGFLTFFLWGVPLVVHGLIIVGLNLIKDVKFYHSAAGLVRQGGAHRVFVLATLFYMVVAVLALAANYLLGGGLFIGGLIFALVVIGADLQVIFANADDYMTQRYENYYEDKYS